MFLDERHNFSSMKIGSPINVCNFGMLDAANGMDVRNGAVPTPSSPPSGAKPPDGSILLIAKPAALRPPPRDILNDSSPQRKDSNFFVHQEGRGLGIARLY
jgi:hypothetical protein